MEASCEPCHIKVEQVQKSKLAYIIILCICCAKLGKCYSLPGTQGEHVQPNCEMLPDQTNDTTQNFYLRKQWGSQDGAGRSLLM